jgi:hypothetical protein
MWVGVWLVTSCSGGSLSGSGDVSSAGASAVARLRRLTVSQYQHCVADAFGDAVSVSEPKVEDLTVDGSTAAGSAQVGMPSVDAEGFAQSADSIARQVTAASNRSKLLCDGKQEMDQGCAKQQIQRIGRALYRKPLSSEQAQRLSALFDGQAKATGDAWQGLQAALAAMLNSPYFLYRIDTAGAVRDNRRQVDAFSVASRLSFLVWDRGPDEELLDAAENGSLLQRDVLQAQAERLIGDQRSADGLMPFFTDLFRLNMIAAAQKDPNQWPLSLQAELEQQVRLTVQDHLLTQNLDYRDLFTTSSTFVNQDLSARYGYASVVDQNFVFQQTSLSDRTGLLGLPGIQAMLSFSSRTSPTKRGLYIRSALLCTDVPSPPATVNTSVAGDGNRQMTLRQIMVQHAANPQCSGCHALMDPLGFALEDFDWLGNYRTQDQNLSLDLTGSLDGKSFVNARTLGLVLHDDPELTSCLVQRFVLAATSQAANLQSELTTQMEDAFARGGYRYKDLLMSFVLSDAFREAP